MTKNPQFTPRAIMFRRLVPILLTVSLLATPQIGVTQTIDQLFDQANTAYDQGKYTEAERIFRQVIQIDPNNADAYTKLCNVLDDLDKLDEAIAACRQGIKLNQENSYAYFLMGFVLAKQNKLDEAIAAYQQAIKLNPDDATAYNNLGIALSDQGKLDEAIAAYSKVLGLPDQKGKVANTHTLGHNNLGFVFQQQGKYQKAIAEYEKAIKLDPNYATAQNNLKEAQRLLAIANVPIPPNNNETINLSLLSPHQLFMNLPKLEKNNKSADWFRKDLDVKNVQFTRYETTGTVTD
ncbi:tetratricopeptide repeat protein [Crocosphaera sp. XPORK-15E]|uniref:tetratricopeptide repeat protein n=1 Tax=Crocosphaera sp. XPORK-15E TaxID=3110247 RepID=UPI002B1EE947|nr:tetratricopeptide repeat protein [Crocosphaera sp. XPORK-15E]MEA5533437.1 tetratricopeptide repeat protein [Crocosphaera sp. XPORK-15E]